MLERPKPSLPPGEYVPFRPGPDGLKLDGMPAFNEGYKLLVEGQLHDEWGNRAGTIVETSAAIVRRLTDKVLKHEGDLLDVEGRYLDDAEVVVVAYGSPVRPAMQAVREARAAGIKAGCLKMRIVWPFPDRGDLRDRLPGEADPRPGDERGQDRPRGGAGPAMARPR